MMRELRGETDYWGRITEEPVRARPEGRAFQASQGTGNHRLQKHHVDIWLQ